MKHTAPSLIHPVRPRGPRLAGWARRGLALAGRWPLLVLLAAGCRSSEEFRSTSSPILTGALPLQVTLSPELRRLKERTSVANEEIDYKVYRLLRPMFPATDGAAFLSLVESRLEPDLLAPWRTRYRMSVNLQDKGAIHRIEATAVSQSSAGPQEAARQAIEEVLLDLYRQIDQRLQS